MIHLDTNFLIGSVTTKSTTASRILFWINSGEKFAASSVTWSEFLKGPVTSHHLRVAWLIIQGRVLPFTVNEAETAARLFNQTGRRRTSQADCLIAAAAICANSALATHDQKDFAVFVPFGLRLA